MTDRPIAGMAHQMFTIELRDLFAMQVVNALITVQPNAETVLAMAQDLGIDNISSISVRDVFCRNAYLWADAMLVAREADLTPILEPTPEDRL